MQIVSLPAAQYRNYPLHFEYDTTAYYDLVRQKTETGLTVTIEKKPMPRTHKEFESALYKPFFENVQAFGLIDNEGRLAGFLQVNHEKWNDRLRVTDLLVPDGHRRRGYGTLLMCKAKAVAKTLGCRAIVLETQSCNAGAIAFYKTQGFELIGFDTMHYSNTDIEEHEVRIELGQIIR